jgi:hypothetical protein
MHDILEDNIADENNGNEKKSITNESAIVIFPFTELTDMDKLDKSTFQQIAAHITDPAKFYEFDCIFSAKKRSHTRNLSVTLSKKYGFILGKPYRGTDCWMIESVKLILHCDLPKTLAYTRVEAKIHSCELLSWIFLTN